MDKFFYEYVVKYYEPESETKFMVEKGLAYVEDYTALMKYLADIFNDDNIIEVAVRILDETYTLEEAKPIEENAHVSLYQTNN